MSGRTDGSAALLSPRGSPRLRPGSSGPGVVPEGHWVLPNSLRIMIIIHRGGRQVFRAFEQVGATCRDVSTCSCCQVSLLPVLVAVDLDAALQGLRCVCTNVQQVHSLLCQKLRPYLRARRFWGARCSSFSFLQCQVATSAILGSVAALPTEARVRVGLPGIQTF